MKILFVHDRFGNWAGAEANLFQCASELARRGHAIALLHGPGTAREEQAWRALFGNRFFLHQGVREAIRKFQPDLCYVHKVSDLGTLESLGACGVPVVRMVHDHEMYCLRGYKYSVLSRQICRRPLSGHCIVPCGAVIGRNHDGLFPVRWVSYADKQRELELNRKFSRMIVATKYMEEELLRNGFYPSQISIHAPVPPRKQDSTQSRFSDRNLLLYVGQIIRGKGVDVLLESLSRLTVPFECVILGDGSHRGACESLSRRLGLRDRVCFKGYVPPSELDACYAECSALLVSSVWPEPFGAVGLEAMRHGVPVVAFDAGGIREWLTDGQNGFLVPWMDRVAYARRVQQLLEDKGLARRLGANGRALLEQDFDFGRYIDSLERLFQQTLQPQPLEAA